MKIFFADTNLFIRFFLQDNLKLARKAKFYFLRAKNKKIKLVVISEIIPEIEYILRKVYHLPKKEVEKHLSGLLKAPYFEVERRNFWLEAVRIYQETEVDLVDIFLFLIAKKEEAQVLSFDEDFRKLARIIK